MKKISLNEDSKEKINAILLIIFLYINTLTLLGNTIFDSEVVAFIITFIIIIISLIVNKFEFNRKMVIFSTFVFIIFLINFLIVDFKSEALVIFIDFLKFGLISLYLASLVTNYNYFLKFGYIISIMILIIWTFFIGQVSERNISYMLFGRQLTFSFVIFIIYFYKKDRKIIHLILALISFTFITLMGNRSSLLICIMLFILLEFDYLRKNLNLRNYFKAMIYVVITILLYIKIDVILYKVMIIANKLNINSYVLKKAMDFLNDETDNSLSSRSSLTHQSIEIIYSNNLMPNGIGYFQKVTNGTYPHNIFIDILITFGFFGILIIAGLFIWILVIYNKQNNSDFRMVIFSLLVYNIIRLNFSGTFWDETLFFALLGLLMSYKFKDRPI